MQTVKIVALIFLTGVVGFYGILRYNRPFGVRTCFIPCMVGALYSYSRANSDKYPDDVDPFAALQMLYPEYVQNPELLAGISGDRRATTLVVTSGGRLTSNESSWVYIPGLSTTNEAKTIMIYETRQGLAFNGARTSGRAVGFIDGSHWQIPEHEFQRLLQMQTEKRRMTR